MYIILHAKNWPFDKDICSDHAIIIHAQWCSNGLGASLLRFQNGLSIRPEKTLFETLEDGTRVKRKA